MNPLSKKENSQIWGQQTRTDKKSVLIKKYHSTLFSLLYFLCFVVFQLTTGTQKLFVIYNIRLSALSMWEFKPYLGVMLRRRKRRISRKNGKNLRFMDNFYEIKKIPLKFLRFRRLNKPYLLHIYIREPCGKLGEYLKWQSLFKKYLIFVNICLEIWQQIIKMTIWITGICDVKMTFNAFIYFIFCPIVDNASPYLALVCILLEDLIWQI